MLFGFAAHFPHKSIQYLLACLQAQARTAAVKNKETAFAWDALTSAFRADVDKYLSWCTGAARKSSFWRRHHAPLRDVVFRFLCPSRERPSGILERINGPAWLQGD